MAGRNVFMGYLDEEAKTRETIDDDGLLHSGDVGKVDADGFLFITGRIKGLQNMSFASPESICDVGSAIELDGVKTQKAIIEMRWWTVINNHVLVSTSFASGEKSVYFFTNNCCNLIDHFNNKE